MGQEEIVSMQNRNHCCPKCSGKLLARINDKIYCLTKDCTWFIEPKRREDINIQDIHKVMDDWK